MAYPFRLTGTKYANSLSGKNAYAGTKTAPYKDLSTLMGALSASQIGVAHGYFEIATFIDMNRAVLKGDGLCELVFNGSTCLKDIYISSGIYNCILNLNDNYLSEGIGTSTYHNIYNCIIKDANLNNSHNGRVLNVNINESLIIDKIKNGYYSGCAGTIKNSTLYGSGVSVGTNYELKFNEITYTDCIIDNHPINISTLAAATASDYLCLGLLNSYDINGTTYAVGEISTKAELQAACVAEYAGSLTDYFDNSFVEDPSFKNKTRNVFIPTNENLWTGSSTGSYLGYTDPTGTSIKVEIAAVPDNFYLDYANGENVDAGTDFLFQDLGASIEFASLTNDVWYIVLSDSVTINGTDVYEDGDKYLKKAGDTESAGNQKYKAYNEGSAESNIIYLPVAKKITSLAMFGQNTNDNRNRVDSTPQVSETAIAFSAPLTDGVDYIVGAGGVTIDATDVYEKGDTYRFSSGDAQTTGNPDYFLLTETRETIDLRFRNFDLGTALTTSDTLTANYWYIVTAGVATYNGNSYRKNQSFKCLTGITSFTGSGAEVKEVFQTDGTGGYHDFQPYAVDLTLSATTTDDDPLEANMSNLQYSNGHALYQAAVDGGKTEHEFYPIYFQDRTKLIIDL